MGAVVAGATQGPLTAIIMLFELTGDYEIILPLMVACILSTSLTRLVMGGSLYTLKLRERGIATYGARDPAILRSLTVDTVLMKEVTVVREDSPLTEVMRALGSAPHPSIPVVDGERRLIGIVSLTDIRQVLGEADALRGLVRAIDLGPRQVVTARVVEDLEVVLERMEEHDFENLPVVDGEAPPHLLGLVTRQAILERYAQVVAEPGLLAAAS
jgi:CIC family chloride channel protein